MTLLGFSSILSTVALSWDLLGFMSAVAAATMTGDGLVSMIGADVGGFVGAIRFDGKEIKSEIVICTIVDGLELFMPVCLRENN